MNRPLRAPFRQRGLHCVRVMMFVVIIGAIHLNHNKKRAAKSTQEDGLRPLTIEVIKEWLPDAAQISSPGAQAEIAQQPKTGWQRVQSAGETLVVEVSQTSPGGDSFIGFSGPTNLLVALEPEQKTIHSVNVLSSRDTRDHVRAIIVDPNFLPAFAGISTTGDDVSRQIESIDAVSGATLTSLAIKSTLLNHLGATETTLAKFGTDVDLEAVQSVFPAAAQIRTTKDSKSHVEIRSSDQQLLGYGLRTSPAADDLIGFQGPTDSMLMLDRDGIAIGLAVLGSFDNQPYTVQVAGDEYFLQSFEGMNMKSIAGFDLNNSDLEGVSGATMTSQTVLDGVQKAAQTYLARVGNAKVSQSSPLPWRDLGTIVIVLTGVIIAMTSLRSHKWLRRVFQVSMVIGLGFVNGDFVSQALVGGWALHGVPWRVATGLVLLVAVAFLFPVASKRNLYCSHLCPHGALQQWVRPRLVQLDAPHVTDGESSRGASASAVDDDRVTVETKRPQSAQRAQKTGWGRGRQIKIRLRYRAWLGRIPAMVLVACFIVVLFGLPFSLVDIEPFDAWIFRVAGWSSIAIALIGIAAACFVPMAYCQYGCPTGALLQHLRYNGRSGDWTLRDWVALCMMFSAVAMWLSG